MPNIKTYSCRKCSKELKPYTGDWFVHAFGQIEGVICKGCGKIFCDTCHPAGKENVCPDCKAELLPCIQNNLELYYKPPTWQDTLVEVLGCILAVPIFLGIVFGSLYYIHKIWNFIFG